MSDPEKAKTTSLEDFPPEMVSAIAENLSMKDIAGLAGTNRAYNSIFKDKESFGRYLSSTLNTKKERSFYDFKGFKEKETRQYVRDTLNRCILQSDRKKALRLIEQITDSKLLRELIHNKKIDPLYRFASLVSLPIYHSHRRYDGLMHGACTHATRVHS